MKNNKFVLDANVFLEYIFGRNMQTFAKYIIAQTIKREYEVIIPTLALDEISEVLCGNMDDIQVVESHIQYLEKLIFEGYIKPVVPNSKIRMEAIKMARLGNKKSGYPEFTDCLYHSVAIFNKAIFITNDKKHYAKVKHYGNIKLLSDLMLEVNYNE